MDYVRQIEEFIPANKQEKQDKKVILDYIKLFPHNILLRSNEFAHITSSGFIMNKSLDKVLLIHHNIMGIWAWTGGHVDGDDNFLHVAIKEAKEETGISEAVPLTDKIISLDVLPVYGHMKKGEYVSSHLHLSIAYILVASEKEVLTVNEEETGGVAWFGAEQFTRVHFDDSDVYLYNKLIQRARQI